MTSTQKQVLQDQLNFIRRQRQKGYISANTATNQVNTIARVASELCNHV